MSKERANDSTKMNTGRILRFIWWHYIKRIKLLTPFINKVIVSTNAYQKFRDRMSHRYDIYYNQEAMEKARVYFETNKERTEKIKSKLSDEKSLTVYDNLIHFRCTRDSKYLEDIIDGNQYFDKGLIKFDNKEIYVDCGPCDGDTIRSFLKNLREGEGKFKEIIGIEPDPDNYKKLTNWASSLSSKASEKVTCYNVGVWNEKGVLEFQGGVLADHKL